MSEPLKEIISEVTNEPFPHNWDIRKLDVGETFRFISAARKGLSESPRYNLVLNGVLWELPVKLGFEVWSQAV